MSQVTQKKHSFNDYLKLKKSKRANASLTPTPQSSSFTDSTAIPRSESIAPSSPSINEAIWSDFNKFSTALMGDRALPPLLSPTIPDIYVHQPKKHENEEDVSMKIPRMLSPTLPPRFLEQPIPRRDLGTERLLKDEGVENKDDELLYAEERRGAKNFEKVEHLGVHSYRLLKNNEGKKLLLTLHVPKWFKKHPELKTPKPTAYKIKKHQKSVESNIVGLGIHLSKKRSMSTVNDTEEKPKKKLVKVSSKESPVDQSSPPSASSPPKEPTINNDMTDEEKISMFKSKFEEYLVIAKGKKHKADALKPADPKLSMILYMDCIIIYLVAFHYEDQSRKISKKLQNDQTWLSLPSLVDHVYRMCVENDVKDIAGLCLQIKGIVFQHVCKILDDYIQNDALKKKDGEDVDSLLLQHLEKQRKYRDLATRSLIHGEDCLNIFDLQERYPKIVQLFRRQPKSENSITRMKKTFGVLLDPMVEDFQLPITGHVSVREMAGYAFKILRQWNQDSKIGYSEWTFE